MAYRDNIKVLLMRGKLFRMKGQGIAGFGQMRRPVINNNYTRGTGTISNRAILDEQLTSDLSNMTVKAPSKSKGSKKGSFKSLKFNF